MDGWMDGLEGVEINYLYCVVLHVSVLVLDVGFLVWFEISRAKTRTTRSP